MVGWLSNILLLPQSPVQIHLATCKLFNLTNSPPQAATTHSSEADPLKSEVVTLPRQVVHTGLLDVI